MAQLLGIAIRKAKRAPMQPLQQAAVTRSHGVGNDFRGRPGKRQVTLLSLHHWQAACNELGVELPWLSRRANLLVDRLELAHTTGAIITLGSAQLEITGETDPCERMEETHPGLFNALARDWRGGVTCRVLGEGIIEVGMVAALQGS